MNIPNTLFKNKLRNYSILAGAALSTANVAEGQIVHHDFSPNILLNGNSSYNLDLNGDGLPDYQFNHASGSFNFEFAAFKMLKSNVSFAGTERSFISSRSYIGVPSVLNQGSSIGANKKWGGYQGLHHNNFNSNVIFGYYYSGGTYGHWAKGETDKFVGLRIKSSDTEFNYGWIRCSVAPGATSLTLIDYAYQTTPNEPIIAGDTGTGCPYLPVSITAFPKKIQPGDSSRLKLSNVASGETFVWFRNSKAFKVTNGKHSIFVKKDGNYWAEVTTPQGCIRISDTVHVTQLQSLTQSDKSAIDADAENIYTANKILYVKLSSENYLPDGIVCVYNSVGQILAKQKISSNDFTMNLQSLNTGIYFVKLTNGRNEINQKIFIE